MEQDEKLFSKILKEDYVCLFSCTGELLEFHKNFLDDLENSQCSGYVRVRGFHCVVVCCCLHFQVL